jgi:hypothetical protein
MGLEGEFLRAQHHSRRNPLPPEQIRRDERALQTKDLLWVPDAGVVDRSADAANGFFSRGSWRDCPTLDHFVYASEGRECAYNVVGDQHQQRTEEQH